jgi:hypothetical protein
LPGSSRIALHHRPVTYGAIFNLTAVRRTWVENGQAPRMLVPVVSAAVLLLLRRLPALSLSRPQ